MNVKTTLVLGILVALLGGLWLVDGLRRGATPPAPEVAADPSVILNPEPTLADIQAVRIAPADAPELRFATDDGETWNLTAPLNAEAERYLLTGLVNKCGGLKSQREFTDVTPADAGLQPPKATIALTAKDGQEYLFEIGKRVPVSNEHYVRVTAPGAAPRIYGVAQDFSLEIGREARDYRSKMLLKMPTARTVGLDVTHDGKRYQLARAAGEPQWMFETPVRALADSARINAVLATLGGLRIGEFIADDAPDLAKYGLDTPYLAITVALERDAPPATQPAAESQAAEPASQPAGPPEVIRESRGVLVGDFADLQRTARYVKLPDQPWIASVPVASLDSLVPKPAEWRDTRVVRLDADAVTRLEVTQGPNAAVLNRVENAWQGDGDLARPDAAAIEDLLNALVDLRAIDFEDAPRADADYGFDPPRTALQLTQTGILEPIRILIGGNTPSGRNSYVRVAGQDSIGIIASAQADRLSVSPLALRSPQIFELDGLHIQRIEAAGPAGTRVAERSDGVWKLLEPAGAALDAAALADLTIDLALLRGRRIADKGNFDQYGLDQPVRTLRFVVQAPPPPPASQPASDAASAPSELAATEAPPAETHTLTLGKVGQTLYAARDDEPFVYELDPTVEPVLTGEWLPRKLLDVAPEDVTGLSVKSGAGELAFERVDDQWRYAADPYVKLSQPVVNELLNAVLGLEAVAYQAWSGGVADAAGFDAAGITVTLTRKAGDPITLRIASQGDVTARPAAWVEAGRLFTVDLGRLTSLSYPLDRFVEAADADE